jgi:hypothetical protein
MLEKLGGKGMQDSDAEQRRADELDRGGVHGCHFKRF